MVIEAVGVQAAKVTNIILREAMGLDNPFRFVLRNFTRSARLGGI